MAKKTATEKLKPLRPINWKQFGPGPVVGLDEVGRGCLAGPVYAGAVIFKSERGTRMVTDSKLLSEGRRDELSKLIWNEHYVGIGCATVEEIDEINILQASFLAMRRAVAELQKQLALETAFLLVDGHMRIPQMEVFQQKPIIKGDLRVSLIAAASIVAKVARDQMMKDLGEQFPHYGFEIHKGYATSYHREAIQLHGPCAWHRRTFGGVKEHLELEQAYLAAQLSFADESA
jgi:ribonuclease HII